MNNTEKNAQNPTQSGNVKKKTGLIAGICVAVVVVVAIVIALVITLNPSGSNEEAMADCERKAAALTTSLESMTTVRESADEVSGYTADDVVDPTTLDDLQSAFEDADALPEAPSCPTDGSAEDYENAIDEISEYSNDLRVTTNKLDTATKAVISSNEELLGIAE